MRSGRMRAGTSRRLAFAHPRKRTLLSTRVLRILALSIVVASTGCVLHVNRELSPPAGFTYTPNTHGHPEFSDPSAGDPPDVRLSPMDQTHAHDILRIEYAS